MNKDKFGIFIFCWGRPNFSNTIKTLRRCGYTGDIYCLLDDLDETRFDYIKRYGKEKCFVFDKKQIASKSDPMNNFGRLDSTLFVENVMFDAAKHFCLDYFCAMCDDYTQFSHKREKERRCKRLDEVFTFFIDFLKNTPLVKCIAFAQGGDFSNIGKEMTKRKVMNSFICCTERPFVFKGAMNDDVNMYVYNGVRGALFFTYMRFMLHQPPTQIVKGGLSETYKHFGTYVKSFYSVMLWPCAVKVCMMGQKNPRIHHVIDYNKTVPKIIDEKWKKNAHK